MMKRIIYLLLIIVMPICALANDEANILLKKGNDQYAKGQYKEAITTYQKIVDDGHQSALVYYNLGNAYFKNEDVPSALLYYEKAHKLSPGDEDINFNIQFANQKTTDKVEAGTEFFITKWWHSFILRFSLTTLAVMTILFFVAGCALLIVYRFTNSVGIKKWPVIYTSVPKAKGSRKPASLPLPWPVSRSNHQALLPALKRMCWIC
jgi:tetratricopeptide (TPR) repeat protein